LTAKRAEIWIANLGDPPQRHWVLIVSLDARNKSDRTDSVLIIPLGRKGAEGPTTMLLQPGESGLPRPSWLKGHFITTLAKSDLIEYQQRKLSASRMREVSAMIRPAFDPDAPMLP